MGGNVVAFLTPIGGVLTLAVVLAASDRVSAASGGDADVVRGVVSNTLTNEARFMRCLYTRGPGSR